jgi:transposase, IS6 family
MESGSSLAKSRGGSKHGLGVQKIRFTVEKLRLFPEKGGIYLVCCDFLLSESRDLTSARRFFQKALAAPGHPRPRVINVDGNPSYPNVIEELKQERVLARRCRCRIVPYLNNIVEQDHRSIKRRVNASLGFRSFDGAQRTIQGDEAMHMIRKGQVRWLSKDDTAAQVRFIKRIFGVAA